MQKLKDCQKASEDDFVPKPDKSKNNLEKRKNNNEKNTQFFSLSVSLFYH